MLSSQPKRPRAGSVSGRLRSVSILCTDGVITNDQKGIVKDLIISGDKELEKGIDEYLQGNQAYIMQLINSGHLNTRKSTFDYLNDFGMDGMDINAGMPIYDQQAFMADNYQDNYYNRPRGSSVNPFSRRENSVVETPFYDYNYEGQVKANNDNNAYSQFGNFVDYQTEKDADYLEVTPYNMMNNNDNRSDSMSPNHGTYSESFSNLSFIQSNAPNMYTSQPMGYMDNTMPMMNQTLMGHPVTLMSNGNQPMKPPTIKTSEADLPPVEMNKHEPGKKYIGAYSPESRRKRLEKFFEKRKQRVWTKRVKYDVRKNFADSRLRVKGRFVKKEDEELLRELMNLT
ncbi:hypothetical protein WA158_001693 [Blastocystis sp. Blastoise]